MLGSHLVNRTHAIFKLCTIVALILAFALTICAVFSVWNFAQYDTADRALDHKSITPAYTYFDMNRDAKAILFLR